MPITDNYAKITMQCATDQKPAFYNVFYFLPDGDPVVTSDPITDAAAVAVAAQANIAAHVPGVLTTNSKLVGFQAEVFFGGRPFVVDTILNTAGTVINDEEPDWVAVCIQKRTATPGKSGRGRWFLGPVPEEVTDEDRIIVGYQSAYDAVANDWLLSGTALGVNWRPHLYSKKNEILLPLTSSYVDRRLASINGRKRHTLL